MDTTWGFSVRGEELQKPKEGHLIGLHFLKKFTTIRSLAVCLSLRYAPYASWQSMSNMCLPVRCITLLHSLYLHCPHFLWLARPQFSRSRTWIMHSQLLILGSDWYQWIPASSGSTTRESIVSGRTWALPWGVIYYNLFTVVVQKQYISGYSLCQSHELYEKENGINVRFLPVEKGSNVHPPQGPRRERRAVFPGKHSPETKQDSRIFRSW